MQTLTTPLKLNWSIDRVTNGRVDEKIVHFWFVEGVVFEFAERILSYLDTIRNNVTEVK